MPYVMPLYNSNLGGAFSTFAIEFTMAITSAKLDLAVANFKQHFLQCLYKYKDLHMQSVEFVDTIINNHKAKEIMNLVEKEC